MEQQGRTVGDLEPYIATSAHAFEVLNRKRSVCLRMIRKLHNGLQIPYESLLVVAA